MTNGKYVASEKERCQNETYHKILTEIRIPKSEEEIDSILSCCDHDLNANLKDNKLMTLLHHAMRSHNFYLARRLVADYGADVGARSKSGITPLHMLCKTRQMKEKNDSDEEDLEEWARRTVERTRMKKKDKRKFTKKDGDDKGGSTDQDIISFLVKNGANVNATDYSGSTPLHYTALYNQPEYARGLIKNGADLECRDIEGMTPFILAVEKNHTSVGKVLLENGADYSAKDNNDNNVLHLCCLNKDHATLGLLSEYLSQLDVNFLRKLLVQVNRSNETPAHYAARREDPTLLQSMLPITIDPEHIDTKGRNWLHIAAETMEPDIVNVMLEYGIDINSTDSEGNTPLTIAARFGNAPMANKLIQNGAKVNCPNNRGKTPLMIACQTKNEHLVESLLTNGADASLLDNQQNSAFYFAIKARNYNIVSNLHNEGAYRWALNFCRQTPLHIAASKGHLKVATHLTEVHPFSIDAGDENGNTALHYAARNGHVSVVEHLLTLSRPTYNAKNVQGRTALMYAAENDQTECIEALLKARNLNVNMTDNFGRTPLMIACEQGNANSVRLLLKNGAELTYCISHACKPFAGWNALNLAIWSRNLDCVLEILNSDNWRDAMWNTAKDLNGEWMTPMRQMIKELPKAALCVLDKSVEHHEEPDDPKSTVVKFDFRFLEQWESYMRSPWTQRPRFLRNCCKPRQKYTHDDITVPFLHSDQVCVLDNRSEPELVHPMRLMLKYNREELISHPVVQSILSQMWQPVLGLYLLNMGFFLLFIALFTSFMVLTDPPYLLLGQRSLSTAELCAEMEQNQQKAYHLFVQFPKYALMVASIINILKEIAQLCASGRSYLTLENLVEWTIFVLAIVTTIDTSKCMAKTGLREHWQWQTGTVGLTLAWVDMLFFMQRLFPSGNYLGTFVLISKNLLKLFIIFSPFWIAFMIGFHLLLANHYAFMDMGNSLTKMITMTSGEVDFSGTMMSHYDKDSGPEAAVYYASVTYALMLLFICIMTIAMQNMLTAIAVGDVNEMQGRAHFDRLRKTTETLLNLRGVMVFLRIWRPLPTVYTYSLDQPRGFLFGWIYKAMGGTQEYEIDEEKEDEAEDVTHSLSLLNELRKTIVSLEESVLALHKTLLQGK